MNPNQPLIDSKKKFVIAISGGGQEIIGGLTRHGGMSGTLLEAIVPYGEQAFLNLIGGKPDQFVSHETVRAMAMACYQRATTYAPNDEVFGIAATSSIAKVKNERVGRRHKVYIGLQRRNYTGVVSIEYKAGRTREEEESLTARCIGEVVKWGCKVFGDVQRQLNDGDQISMVNKIAASWIVEVATGMVAKCPSNATPKALFSSSCHPLHGGHIRIMDDAAKRLDTKIALELCVYNADKPPLDYISITERMGQAYKKAGNTPWFDKLVITNRPLYSEKAEIFPACTFVMGMDTFDRFLDPKYYGGGTGGGDKLFSHIFRMQQSGHRFLVYPRKGYQTPIQLQMSPWNTIRDEAMKITTIVAPVDGYEESDLSSTSLRKADTDVES